MKDFFLNNYTIILLCIELFAVVAGVFYYKKFQFTITKYFIYFLFYAIICQRLALYTYHIYNDGFLSFLKGTLIQANYWWCTLYWNIGVVAFFGFYFYYVLDDILLKKALKFSTITFLFTSFIDIVFNLDLFFKGWLTYNVLSGTVIIFLSVALYFLELLKSDKILKFYTSIHFYIATAVMFFWLIITPVVFFSKYFNTSDWNFIFLRWQIYLFANVFMYGMFTVGLIVSKPEIENK